MEENTPKGKRAGATSIRLPEVSLKLGGESPGPPEMESAPLPWRAGRGLTSIPFVGLVSNVVLRYIRGARAGVPRTRTLSCFSIHRPEHGGHIPYGAGLSNRPWPPSIHRVAEKRYSRKLGFRLTQFSETQRTGEHKESRGFYAPALLSIALVS
jgi:hypothetical protein